MSYNLVTIRKNTRFYQVINREFFSYFYVDYIKLFPV